MAQVTEIAHLWLKEGVNPEVNDSLGALVLQKCFNTLSKQPGWIRKYWGIQVENPRIVIMTIDWKDLRSHQDFVNSSAYNTFAAELAQIFDFFTVSPLIYHVNFTSDSVAAREAPVTEFAPVGVSLKSTDAERASFKEKVLALSEYLKNEDKVSTYALGWVLEELENANAPEGKAKMFVTMLGWATVDDHASAAEKPKFKDLLAHIKEAALPPVAGRGPFHVKLHGE